jgi:hypothetical protein
LVPCHKIPTQIEEPIQSQQKAHQKTKNHRDPEAKTKKGERSTQSKKDQSLEIKKAPKSHQKYLLPYPSSKAIKKNPKKSRIKDGEQPPDGLKAAIIFTFKDGESSHSDLVHSRWVPVMCREMLGLL